MRWAIWVLLVGSTSAFGAPERLRVAFVQAFESEPWGQRVVAAMQAAAEDLDIDLVVQASGHWPTETLSRVEALLHSPERPDYLVISIHRAIGVGLLRVAERARVPVFVINAGLLDSDRTRYGGPRDYFKYWVGQMLPNDELAGYSLASYLLKKSARPRPAVIALGGVPVDFASLERDKGLRRAVAEHVEADLLQVVAADWDFELAARKVELLLRRHRSLNVVWAANDLMALGALESVERKGIRPGTDVVVGGMNWIPSALKAIREGKMAASVDGHFLEGAWAIVLLHDHAKGMDFAEEHLDWRSEMTLISRDNIDRYENLLDHPELWRRIDFAAFSKVKNHALKSYRFSFEAAFNQLRP